MLSFCDGVVLGSLVLLLLTMGLDIIVNNKDKSILSLVFDIIGCCLAFLTKYCDKPFLIIMLNTTLSFVFIYRVRKELGRKSLVFILFIIGLSSLVLIL